MEILVVIVGVVALAIGGGVGLVMGRSRLLRQQEVEAQSAMVLARAEATEIVANAKTESKDIILEADSKAKARLDEADGTIARRRQELDREEEGLERRRGNLDKRAEEIDNRQERSEQREKSLQRWNTRLTEREAELENVESEKLEQLQRIAQMTVEEARTQLMQLAEQSARNDVARIIRQVEAEAHETAERRARSIIALAVQRLASEHVSEISVSVVTLPADDMKGRIIGRNGRNIRSFEIATGVDVIVDDTPEVVTISSFDPVRREVARQSLTKLVSDGRIHPAHIERIVDETRSEIDRTIREEGERAAYVTGVHGLSPEILRLLGQLNFRTSYGQNQLAHSIETAHLAGMIAAELGGDVDVAKAGGLLHDIGKAIDHEVEGTHALIGADFIARYGLRDDVVNCVAAHHNEVDKICVEAYIVEAADAISGARPGARRESLEAYVKRVKALEEIANSFQGVEQSYALQAGREVRILVKPEEIDDLEALQLAKNVARQIEENMNYPGQIKVHVIPRNARHRLRQISVGFRLTAPHPPAPCPHREGRGDIAVSVCSSACDSVTVGGWASEQ